MPLVLSWALSLLSVVTTVGVLLGLWKRRVLALRAVKLPQHLPNVNIETSGTIGARMNKVIRRGLLSALAFMAFLPGLAADQKPWDAVPQMKCSEVFTSAGEFTPRSESAFTWMVGYMDGLRAASMLDKRLRTLSEAGSLTIGTMLLAYCQKKPEDTLRGAATSVAEFLMNAQPGRRLDLEWNW
jgi:hypothetical protein